MQAQAYRCTKQLHTIFPRHNISLKINRTPNRLVRLQHTCNPNKNLIFSNRWTPVSSSTSLPQYAFHNNFTNARFYSSKRNKYCLKRHVKGQKSNKLNLEVIKDVVSDVSESVRCNISFLRDRMLQSVFAINGIDRLHTDKKLSMVSFSRANKNDTRLAESNTNVQLDSVIPITPVANSVNDLKLRRWHRITGTLKRIPSQDWKWMIPLISKERNNSNNTKDQDNTIESKETQINSTSLSDKNHVVSAKHNLTSDATTDNFDSIKQTQTVDKSSGNVSASIIESDSKPSSQYNWRMNSLRERLPPLSMPSAISDRLPSLMETTSKVKQTVESVSLPKWTSSKKAESPTSKGEFDLDSPLLLSETKHYKEGHKSDASLVAEQLLKSAEIAEMKAVKARKSKKATCKVVVSKASIDSRTKTLTVGIKKSTSNASSLIKLERLCNHLVQYPASSHIASKEKLIPCLLKLRQQAARDQDLTSHIHKTLALLGYVDPVRGRGLRVLALDGGGCRGIVAIEALREIERRTNQDIRDMFDFVVGVSSGAVLAYLLSFLNASLDQCEELFRVLGYEVFERNSIVGTSKLLLKHAYYDTDGWIKILKQHAEGETQLIDTAKDPKVPKVAALTNKMNVSSIKNYVFRNYNIPVGSKSQYEGSVKYQCWEALRASSAAPGYFEECQLDDNVFQDGGVLTNNPSAVGLHECRLLWPNTPIQCLVSLGTGRYEPADVDFGVELTSFKTKMYKIMQSATETESVHTILQDLLPEGTYFRFNPHISEDFALDESRPDKLNQMQHEAQVYLENNNTKLDQVAKVLSLQKTPAQKMQDWLKLQHTLYT